MNVVEESNINAPRKSKEPLRKKRKLNLISDDLLNRILTDGSYRLLLENIFFDPDCTQSIV